MARKSCRASLRSPSAGVDRSDLVAGTLGAIGGGVVFVLLLPFPGSEGGPWLGSEGRPSSTSGFAWLLALAAYVGFGCASLVLARVDLRTHTLPNRLVAYATLWTLTLLLTADFLRGHGGTAGGALASSVSATALVWVLWSCKPGFIGGGDVKLIPVAAYAGAWGLQGAAWLAGLFVFLLVFLAGLMVLVAVARIRRRADIAAGPLILAASWSAFVTTHMPEV